MFNKKAVSEIVSYVLLISITFAISGIVYSWLVFYVTPGEEIKCDDGVSLTIRNYEYNCSTKQLNLTLQNRGLFNFDGYIIRVNNQTGSNIGVYSLIKTGKQINTTQEYKDVYANSSILNDSRVVLGGNISFIEIQPFIVQKKNLIVYCEKVAEQRIACS